MNIITKWQREIEQILNEGREWGIGGLIDALGDAIEREGWDKVADDLTNSMDPLTDSGAGGSPDDWVLGRRKPRQGDPNLYPLGPRYSPGGGGHLVIIPGGQKVTCSPVVLTIVNNNGYSWRLGLRRGMDEQWRRYVFTSLKAHLIQCAGIVKFVVVLVDHWDGQLFEREHAAELASWRQRGVCFLFLLVTRQRQISPILVKLA